MSLSRQAKDSVSWLSRQRNLNRGSCHTLILDLKILVQISFLFLILFQFTVYCSAIYYCASAMHVTSSVFKFTLQFFLHFILIFCIKSYKRVFWSFPAVEPIFSPCVCLWVFFNFSVRVICQILFKNHLSLHLSQFESFWPQGHFGLFTLFKFWAERYFKIPHFW